MKTFSLSLLFLFVALTAAANMAAPYRNGTNSARPFTNLWVDILKEELTIKPDRNFRTAYYDIRYHVSVKKDGISIPLLFIALDQSSDFRIRVDGKEVKLQSIPPEFTLDHPGFGNFRYFFEKGIGGPELVTVKETPNGGRRYALHQLKYFTADLSEGEHEIHVSYKAYRWQILSDGWVKTYQFRYALSPAMYWKSFGKLYLTIDASKCAYPLELQLNKRTKIRPGSVVQRTIDRVPSEILYLTYRPEITGFSKSLLAIGPFPIALAIGVILLVVYFLLIRKLKRSNPERNLRIVTVTGGIVVAFGFVYSWIAAYDWIDNALGSHAARYHGYGTVGIFLLLPVLAIVLPAMGFAVGRIIRKR